MNKSTKNIVFALASIGIVVLLNVLFSKVFMRADLTSDKRYTLAESTYEYLDELEDSVHFNVMMGGELPLEYGRVKKDVYDILLEFETYSNGHITFSFINPVEGVSEQELETRLGEIANSGVRPIPVQVATEGGKVEKYIFPAALVSSKQRRTVVNFISNTMVQRRELEVHLALQGIEYELMNAIRKLTKKHADLIGFWKSNATLEEVRMAELKKALSEYYSYDNVEVTDSFTDLSRFKALVIARPLEKFTEAQKFVVDQYVMNGGRVLWAIDLMTVAKDTLMQTSSTMAFAQDLNLNDMLFKYGIRINYNLVLDYKCSKIPLNVAPAGFKSDFKLMNWYYAPTPIPANAHPISKNLSLIKTEYVSSLDTVGKNAQIRKTLLLHSSPYSRLVSSPVMVDLRLVEQPFDERFFNARFVPLAYLLEGEFESIFANRMVPTMKNAPKEIKKSASDGKMIIIGDADLIANDVERQGMKYFTYELGYDSKTGQTFGNKDFLLNAINYLCDEDELIELRAREFKPRFLDKTKLKKYKSTIIFNNVILPNILILLLGIAVHFIRKRRNRVGK